MFAHTSIKIRSLTVTPMPSFNAPAYRPMCTQIDTATVMALLEESPVTATTARNVYRQQPETGKVTLPGGWAAPRFSFELLLEVRITQVMPVQTFVLLGYTQEGADPLKAPDETVFTVNQVLHAQDLGGSWDVYDVVRKPTFESEGQLPIHDSLLTVTAAVGRLQTLEALGTIGGVEVARENVFDTRSALTPFQRFLLVDARLADPLYSLSELKTLTLGTAVEAQRSVHDKLTKEDFYAELIHGLDNTEGLRQLATRQLLSADGTINWETLQQWGMEHPESIVQRRGPQWGYDDFQPWGLMDIHTQMATELTHTLPALLANSGYHTAHFTVRFNETQDQLEVSDISRQGWVTHTATDNENARWAWCVARLNQRFRVLFNTGMVTQIDIECVVGQYLIAIFTDEQGTKQRFAAPLYATSHYSPLVGSRERLDMVASDIDFLLNQWIDATKDSPV